MNTISRISPMEAKQKMDNGAAVLDVREYPEWVESHLPGATLIPLADVKKHPQRAALTPEVLVLCRSGKRAAEAAQTIACVGAATPFIIEGGLDA